MSKQSWRGSTLLNPEPPVLVSCGGLEKPNLITIGWTGTICTQPSMVIHQRSAGTLQPPPHSGKRTVCHQSAYRSAGAFGGLVRREKRP